jgi:hypothetical protein
MTFVVGAGAGRRDNVAVAESTALVVGVVVGGHDDDGGWFGLNCEKSVRLYINRGSFYHPLNDV